MTPESTSPDTAELPDTTELHVAYPRKPPDFERFDVKALTPGTLLGEPCTVAVVGQSHVVTAPALDYHEVCSCAPQTAAASETVALDPGVAARVDTAGEHSAVVATTDLAVRSLSSFPGPDEATIAHRFGSEAWTTVDLADDGTAYETYHTYPERDVAVQTVTRLARESANANGESAEAVRGVDR
ncbi:hypothetical protein C2R22_02255 [Salinigranum rubrum]|uniref:DUF2617 domain-containing protein n=1 Tax=Salinigranum rubrum TaxID=755307 RepID=A0A2I8VFD7_9EURY|nr:DUF2617 family protein [Salinigranum rubrum]AUV80625.1 hypothetical protein C2R22_02255 [Salinigranum rubrum]